MAAIVEICKRVLITKRSFGLGAACESCIDIFRSKIAHSRRYLLFSLEPESFVQSNESFRQTDISIVEPAELEPFIEDSTLELTHEFIKEAGSSRVLLAKSSKDGSLQAYAFFSRQAVAIEGQVFFETPPGSVYLFKVFVVPQMRNQKLARAMVSKILGWQAREQREELFALIISTNFISQAAFKAMGFKRRASFIVKRGSKALVKFTRTGSVVFSTEG